MPKIINLVSFLTHHQNCTEENINAIYGVFSMNRETEKWQLVKEPQGFCFLHPNGRRDFGHHANLHDCIKRAISMGLSVYIDEEKLSRDNEYDV